MRLKIRNSPIFRCCVCGAQSVVLGKGKEWTSVGGGLFICEKQVCKDEFARRPMMGMVAAPKVEPV